MNKILKLEIYKESIKSETLPLCRFVKGAPTRLPVVTTDYQFPLKPEEGDVHILTLNPRYGDDTQHYVPEFYKWSEARQTWVFCKRT